MPQVNQPLVGRATEQKVDIALRGYKRPVNKHIDMLQQRCEVRISGNGFIQIACITPYTVTSASQFGSEGSNLRRLKKRVAAGQSHVKTIFLNHGHNLLYRHVTSARRVPRLRIMTLGALVGASGKIDGCTKPGAIDRCPRDNIKNPQN